MYDFLISHGTLVTFNEKDEILEGAHLLVDGGFIQDVIPQGKALPQVREVINHHGKLVTPGLIDSHTHVVYGGHRAEEFELRLQGASYEELSRKGAGILLTVKVTREASAEELFLAAKKRLLQMIRCGTRTCEIKSGYGLDYHTELKMLSVAKRLKEELPLEIHTTFLGAHALPPEFDSKDDYIDFICREVLPKIAQEKLCDFVDAFCEKIGFSREQVERLFKKAQALGFKLKIHAEQLSDQKGGVLGAQMGALSIDHIEYLSENDLEIIRESGTVATLLPGAFYFLKETKKPPVAALREKNIPIAIATDANPGSSPFLSLPLMMNMACVQFGLTPYEAFKAVTINGAKALGIDHRKGSLTPGMEADYLLWEAKSYSEIVCYPNEAEFKEMDFSLNI